MYFCLKLSTSDIESSLTSVGFFWSRDFPNMNKDEMGQLKHDEIFEIVAKTSKGSFKNYVDKMRWVGGQKMPILVQVQGNKCPRGGR